MLSLPSAGTRRSRPLAFTLVEMLVVISIIVLLMALAVPSFIGSMQSSRLTAAGQNMVGRLSQAQQTAASTNMPVEVRFYKFSDQGAINQTTQFGAYQFLMVKTDLTGGAANEVMDPLSAPFYIESGVYIATNTIQGNFASPLLTGTGVQTYTDDGQVNGGSGLAVKQVRKGTAPATYVAIRFYPDGTVKRLGSSAATSTAGLGSNDKVRQLQALSLPDAYLTLVGEKDLVGGNIANYYAVQLDPYTGHARAYQPGISK